jgi:excinuclease ABC subunit C
MVDLNILPGEPGCYIFKNSKGRIIYIGKAKNIKKRVSSYFQKKGLGPKTKALVGNINSVDFVVTETDVEAYLLENTLIKKHRPKYNIDLKDSRRYAYILLTNESFPRLLVAREKKKEGQYFGPFVSGQERDYILNFLKRTFKLRTCKRFSKRPCLRSHIGRCLSPCIGEDKKIEYQKNISKVKKILKGQTKEALKELKAEMKEMSDRQDYEKAIALRNQISAIERLNERQIVERERKYDEDILNYLVKGGRVHLLAFKIYKGTLTNKEEFSFEHSEGFLEEFLSRYYSENEIPKEIIVPDSVDPALEAYLSKLSKRNPKIIVPKKGEKKALLELVKKNAEISFFGNMQKAEALEEKLCLPQTPRVIECFDISHLSGTSAVGSMVQFRDGLPDKGNYRRFKIRSVEGIDDFRAIGEVVRRRYSRLLKEGGGMPNLIIVDGGAGQLSFALEELRKLGLDIPAISIAKKFEEIYLPGRSAALKLSGKETALKFIQEIRDEAHRFAIKYQRSLRGRDLKDNRK